MAVLLAVILAFPVRCAGQALPPPFAAFVAALLALGAAGAWSRFTAPVVVEQGKELIGRSCPTPRRRPSAGCATHSGDRTVKQLTNGKDVAGMVKDKVPEAMESVASSTLPMARHVVELVSTFVLLVVLAAFLVAVHGSIAMASGAPPQELGERIRSALGAAGHSRFAAGRRERWWRC